MSIVPYGAFVNIEGNIDGLVHISEMAMGRVDSVEDVVQVNTLHSFNERYPGTLSHFLFFGIALDISISVCG